MNTIEFFAFEISKHMTFNFIFSTFLNIILSLFFSLSLFLPNFINEFVGTQGPRKDITSCDYRHKSILSPRRGSTLG